MWITSCMCRMTHVGSKRAGFASDSARPRRPESGPRVDVSRVPPSIRPRVAQGQVPSATFTFRTPGSAPVWRKARGASGGRRARTNNKRDQGRAAPRLWGSAQYPGASRPRSTSPAVSAGWRQAGRSATSSVRASSAPKTSPAAQLGSARVTATARPGQGSTSSCGAAALRLSVVRSYEPRADPVNAGTVPPTSRRWRPRANRGAVCRGRLSTRVPDRTVLGPPWPQRPDLLGLPSFAPRSRVARARSHRAH